MRFLKKLKIENSYDPGITVVGIYPKELKSGSQNDASIPMFIEVIWTIAKIWKQLKHLSTDKWIKKKWYILTMDYSDLKRKASLDMGQGG